MSKDLTDEQVRGLALLRSMRPKPQLPEEQRKPILGIIPSPKNHTEKFFITTVGWSLTGFFAGTVNAWYHDYKKVPFIKFKESLRFHMKYLSHPWKVFSMFGLSYAAIEWGLEEFRGGNGKRSIQERFMSAFLAVGSIALVGVKRADAMKLAVAAGLLNSGVRYYSKNTFVPREQLDFDRYYYSRVPAEEESPEFPDVTKNRMFFSPGYGRDTFNRHGAKRYMGGVKYVEE